jgi:antitoxin (DNA-binding transcriptional repressor) of toxin-antitoxin stability system
MRHVNMHEAKTHLSCLVDEAAASDAFLIWKACKPMARVIPLDAAEPPLTPKRRLGLLQEHGSVPDDFDQIGTDERANLLEGL